MHHYTTYTSCLQDQTFCKMYNFASTTFTKPQESNALFAVKLGAKPEPPLPFDLVRLAQKNGCYLM